MKTHNDIEPVEVFAGSAVQAAMVKSLLGNAEIEAYLKDEFTGILYPLRSITGGVRAVKVFVSNIDQERARIVVDEYERNVK